MDFRNTTVVKDSPCFKILQGLFHKIFLGCPTGTFDQGKTASLKRDL
jgi:hypothetical protein